MEKLNDIELLKKIKEYDFYHRIKLNDNITTPGINRAQIHRNLKKINRSFKHNIE